MQTIGQIFAFDRGTYLSLIHSFEANPYTQYHEIWHQETRNIALSYSVDILIDDCLIIHAFDRQTDRQTDGQRDVDSNGAVYRLALKKLISLFSRNLASKKQILLCSNKLFIKFIFTFLHVRTDIVTFTFHRPLFRLQNHSDADNTAAGKI